MRLSQTQIIRSLGEALQWLEKELSWGAQIAELRHLTGRIGELYAAMITRGQMATAVNQVGYDVVSAEGDRISVKTITSSTKITFNLATIHNASRVMILQIVLDETEPSIRELLDCPADDLAPMLRPGSGDLYVNKLLRVEDPVDQAIPKDLKEVASGVWKHLRVVQLENGTIVVWDGDAPLPQAKPALREIARDIGVDILNGMGNAKNTRTLGADIIKALG